jgi:pimeloyl-ACP methyl ester carboxylesterase
VSEPDAGARIRHVDVRGARHRLLEWGGREAPALVLLHGWMDAGGSFEFLADALRGEWRCIAVDWRGHGGSAWAPEGYYAYGDYLADLDALTEHFGIDGPLALLGHSLGGNIATLYAAVRPGRVRCLVNVEGFGLRERDPDAAPEHRTRWLDDVRRMPSRRVYADRAAAATLVRQVSARASPERVDRIVDHWFEAVDGGYRLRADPALKRGSPDLFRLDEWLACARAVRCPVLWVEAAHSENVERHGLTAETLAIRRASLGDVSVARIADSGHMIHWDRPGALASEAAAFLARHRGA